MSEWLGTGLQNRSHQFESGWNLSPFPPGGCFFGSVLLFLFPHLSIQTIFILLSDKKGAPEQNILELRI